jgi:hypothetical protein
MTPGARGRAATHVLENLLYKNNVNNNMLLEQ